MPYFSKKFGQKTLKNDRKKIQEIVLKIHAEIFLKNKIYAAKSGKFKIV